MYVAKLTRDGDGSITGTERPILVSAPGSANTCGWFHPTRKGEIMFGSTLVPPTTESGPGYQRLGGKYAWQFPHEMEVVTRTVAAMGAAADGETDGETEPMFALPGYDAECSYSPDGRYVLYAHVDDERSAEIGRPDADLYVYDTKSAAQIPLVTEKGYDGGPFFSPDMSWICYRSDRFGDGNLQLFVAELDYSAAGEIEGIKREVQVTSNEHVNWAPYFHPSGRFLVYTTSELGHTNYEVFAIEFNPDKPMEELWKTRVTHAEGFDGLPVFSRDGEWMIWCAQRGELAEGEERPSSQVWAARFDAEALLERVEGGGY
jgi:Tol biopolymer transport system component